MLFLWLWRETTQVQKKSQRLTTKTLHAGGPQRKLAYCMGTKMSEVESPPSIAGQNRRRKSGTSALPSQTLVARRYVAVESGSQKSSSTATHASAGNLAASSSA